ncbi:hypothetical protein HanRHA438_Chr09g0419031 [Helianthus annuus]|nr:hypothetical protein HanXRQr2_Chr09g0407011 [Helianthus annuus]KAJ0527457.1 hypothetical protein HanHA300_Chr09g0334191 [Helianthus annuus]KAJ0536187.1 hypothetical protein HanIR_Chr09g0438791 [Helianthus annuus]KAJ0543866.1 hypothetical protein HanHA89_Chr09g0355261 [Helianthus annuus]KAJ0708919.1 hypothetical protein HanLR1_Chr09g0334561 [Helianthus annuus]
MQRGIPSFFQRQPSNIESSSSNGKPLKIDMDNLPWDPSERKPISSYHPSQKDEIRRTYFLVSYFYYVMNFTRPESSNRSVFFLCSDT